MDRLYDVVMKRVKNHKWYVECINNDTSVKALHIYSGWYKDEDGCIRLRNVITDEVMEVNYGEAKELRPRGVIGLPGGFSFIVLDKLLFDLYDHVFVGLPSLARPDLYSDSKIMSYHSYEYESGMMSEGSSRDANVSRLVPDGIAITGDNLHISQLKPKTLYLIEFFNCAILFSFDSSFLEMYAKWVLLEG